MAKRYASQLPEPEVSGVPALDEARKAEWRAQRAHLLGRASDSELRTVKDRRAAEERRAMVEDPFRPGERVAPHLAEVHPNNRQRVVWERGFAKASSVPSTPDIDAARAAAKDALEGFVRGDVTFDELSAAQAVVSDLEVTL
jgi:hypothetical protein